MTCCRSVATSCCRRSPWCTRGQPSGRCEKGLLQGYRTVEEALPVLRGRIRTEEQLRRRFGLPVPVEVRYDDYSTDTDENRLLRAATERLLRLPNLTVEVRVRLHRLLHRLADVTPECGEVACPGGA